MSYLVSIFFLCFAVLLALRLPRLGKRELILVFFVRLFDLCLFGFVGFLFLLVSGKGCVCDCGTPWTFILPFFHTSLLLQTWPLLLCCLIHLPYYFVAGYIFLTILLLNTSFLLFCCLIHLPYYFVAGYIFLTILLPDTSSLLFCCWIHLPYCFIA